MFGQIKIIPTKGSIQLKIKRNNRAQYLDITDVNDIEHQEHKFLFFLISCHELR